MLNMVRMLWIRQGLRILTLCRGVITPALDVGLVGDEQMAMTLSTA
jgi:hypothetical protein